MLEESQARHLRDVLRIRAGNTVELFDNAGSIAVAVVTQADAKGVRLRVDAIKPSRPAPELVVASAIPKGDRADWMVEKLSELGVSRFIPLRTARSVVHPSGSGKRDRWLRIATESAKQSRRSGVMRIDELTTLSMALEQIGADSAMPTWYLSPRDDALPIRTLIESSQATSLAVLIGPEGGWSDDELSLFQVHRLTPAKLTTTILRIETAAITAAAIAETLILHH